MTLPDPDVTSASGDVRAPTPPPGYVFGPPPPGYPYGPPPPGYVFGPPPPGYVFTPPPPPVGPGGAPLAEAWERLVAYLIDSLILAVVNAVPVIAVLAVALTNTHLLRDITPRVRPNGEVAAFPDIRNVLVLELSVLAIVVPLTLAVSYLYMVTLVNEYGQTVGKRAMKLRIVRAHDGGLITRSQKRKRWLVASAPLTAIYFQYANYLWLLWDKPYRQCLHDKCAETVVVKVPTGQI